jgi:hypothetical protein
MIDGAGKSMGGEQGPKQLVAVWQRHSVFGRLRVPQRSVGDGVQDSEAGDDDDDQ